MSESVHMVCRWAPGELEARPVPDGVRLRPLAQSDAPEVGWLFWSGFGLGGEEGYESAIAALDEARATLAGKWGPMIWDASVLATSGRTVVGASVVVKDNAHQMRPLLAFLVTEPEHQRHGLGRGVLAETLLLMDAVGTRELHLAVNSDNRARSLYHRLGFKEQPPRAVRSA